MRIRFIKTCTVKDHNGEITQSFEEGQVVDLADESAMHWINRRTAVEAGKAGQVNLRAEKPGAELPLKSTPPKEVFSSADIKKGKVIG